MKNLYLLAAASLFCLVGHAQFSNDTLHPLTVCNATSTQSSVAALPDGHGGSFIFWLDKRGNTTSAELYGQHLNANGDTIWATNGKRIAATTRSILAFQAIHWQNGILIAWAQNDTPGYGDSTFCKYIDTSGNDVWVKPTLIAYKGNVSGNTFISIDQDGFNVSANDSGATITHSYTISGGNSGFTFNRIDFNGNLYWPALSKTFALQGYDYRSSGDGQNGWYALSKGNGEGSPMYVQHFNLQGNPLSNTGLDITSGVSANGFNGNITMLPDAQGNLYVTWDAQGGNIEVAKVTPLDSFAWQSQRIRLSDTSAFQPVRSYSRLVGSNLYVTWLEQRLPYVGSDVIQKLDTATGAALWGAGGLVVATVDVYDTYPKLAAADSNAVANTFLGPVNKDMNIQRIRTNGTFTFPGNGKVLGSGNPQALNNGDYTVVDNATGCNPVFWSNGTDIFGSDACITYGGISTSVEEMEANATTSLIVFPNPAHNYITVSNTSAQPLNRVTVYDVTGKLITTTSAQANTTSLRLNINQLQPGIYFIQSTTSGGTAATNRFVVQ